VVGLPPPRGLAEQDRRPAPERNPTTVPGADGAAGRGEDHQAQPLRRRDPVTGPAADRRAEAVLDKVDVVDGKRLRRGVEITRSPSARLELHRDVDRLRVPVAPVLEPLVDGEPG
jgi:hypothetical protein